jgi:transposase-like protein
MDGARFRRLCAGVERLSVAQVRELRARLRGLDARIEVRARIDAGREAVDRCLHCGAASVQRWGATGTGLRRWRCTACRRTFSSTTGTALARLRRPEKFQAVLEDMLSRGAPSSCRALARRLGVNRMTIWRWRMRILAALTGIGATALGGIVEADEKFFRESRKGSREWVNHARDPARFPKPDRPRWRDYRRLGLLRPAGTSKYQIPVLTVTDRAGARRADVLPDRRAESLVARLEAHIRQDAVLCSDGDGAYDLFTRARAMPHYRLPKDGPRVIDTAFHIQTVNNLHSRFESFMKPFCGPATKSLPRYAAWFVARLIADTPAAQDTAWQRLLAA